MLELYSTVNQRIECVVTTHTYVLTGTVNCTALTADDVTGLCKLTSKNFNAKTFALGLAAVL